MQAYIVSLKFAPGLAKEFSLLGQHLEQHDLEVTYLLAADYQWLLGVQQRKALYLTDSSSSGKMISDTLVYPLRERRKLAKLFATKPPDLLVLYNPHPLNFAVAAAAQKSQGDGIRAVYLHEPYKPDKRSFGLAGAKYYELVELFQTLTLRYISDVLLPSNHAETLFQDRYPRYQGNSWVAPIMLPDMTASGSNPDRDYISLVGTVNQSRGLDTFIALVNHSAEQNLDIKFKIVTRSPIDSQLPSVHVSAQTNLEIVNKPKITDQEIAETLAQSFAVFLPHKQVTQSGNIPVSFREGTPVICRNLPGLAQHVTHQVNGYLLPLKPTPAEVLQGVLYVRENLEILSANARQTFESRFSQRNWDRYYGHLLGQLRSVRQHPL